MWTGGGLSTVTQTIGATGDVLLSTERRHVAASPVASPGLPRGTPSAPVPSPDRTGVSDAFVDVRTNGAGCILERLNSGPIKPEYRPAGVEGGGV